MKDECKNLLINRVIRPNWLCWLNELPMPKVRFQKIYIMQRIPKDPFSPAEVDAQSSWGKRSHV